MNNGTEVLSSKIKRIIPELFKMKDYEFYISTSKLGKKLKKEISKNKHVHLIKNELKNSYNHIPRVNYIVARGDITQLQNVYCLKSLRFLLRKNLIQRLKKI